MSERIVVRVPFPRGVTPQDAQRALKDFVSDLERQFGGQVSGRPAWEGWNCHFSLSGRGCSAVGTLAIYTTEVMLTADISIGFMASMVVSAGDIRQKAEKQIRAALGR